MIEFDSLIDDNYFEIPSLRRNEEYDLVKCEEEVKSVIDDFIELQIDYKQILPPRITRNYEIVYSNSNNVSDNVGNFVIKKITKEEEVQKFYDLIYWALTNLNKNEMIYFTEALYYGNSINKISDKYLISLYHIRNIKNSCIIKLAKCFKVVAKKTTTSQKKKSKGGGNLDKI